MINYVIRPRHGNLRVVQVIIMEDIYIDKKALRHLRKDPILADLMKRVVPKVSSFTGDLYVDLCSSIVSQQISTKVAKVIYSRFLDLYDGVPPTPQQLLETEFEDLRAASLSKQKGTYMQNIASFWIKHKLHNQDWDALSDQEILDLLTQIKGVGEWTVQMILMFSLERPDVLPVGDLVIQQSMVKHYGIFAEKKKELYAKMQAVAELWIPYRTIACRYLWRAKDLD